MAKKTLAGCEYDLEAGIIPFDIGTPSERRIYRVSRALGHDLHTIDLMLVTPVFDDVWRDRESHEVEGHILQVVSLLGLTKMKSLAGRPQDLADLAALESLRREQ